MLSKPLQDLLIAILEVQADLLVRQITTRSKSTMDHLRIHLKAMRNLEIRFGEFNLFSRLILGIERQHWNSNLTRQLSFRIPRMQLCARFERGIGDVGIGCYLRGPQFYPHGMAEIDLKSSRSRSTEACQPLVHRRSDDAHTNKAPCLDL